MSRSTLMTFDDSVVPVVSKGISLDLPGPRYVTVPPAIQLTSLISPAETSRRNVDTMSGITTSTPTTTPPITIQFCISGSWKETSDVRPQTSVWSSPDDHPVTSAVDVPHEQRIPRVHLGARAIFRRESTK